MKRRLLVVEPDAAGRAMLDRVLTAAGYTAEEFASAHHARILLDDEAFDLAVVDELAGGGGALDEVRFLREHYPRLPVVVTGTMLTAAVLLDLMRLGVADAVAKPFTPAELRDAVARSLLRASPRHEDALDYAAAVADARRALARGAPAKSARPLARAWSRAPLDAEVVALEALRAELEGRDPEAARGYRAALALRHEESMDLPDPHEGLARLAAYGSALPVATLDPQFQQATIRLIAHPSGELRDLPPADAGAVIVVLALSLTTDRAGAIYLRQSANRAFALLTTDLRPEHAAASLVRLGRGPIVATPADGHPPLDLAKWTELRDAALGATQLAAGFVP